MGAAIIGHKNPQFIEDRQALCTQLDGENLSERTVLILAAGKGVPATHHHEAPAAEAYKVHDHLQLFLREEGGFDTSENDAFVAEQLLTLGRKPFRQHFFALDSLAVKLVLRRTEQRDEPDVLIVVHCPAQKLELPARLTFYIEDLRMVVLDLDKRIQRVVFSDAIVLDLQREIE